MKCLYWNPRGVANVPTRLVLKNLIKSHKPDFFFISEPTMNIDKLPKAYIKSLGMQIFAMNNRPNKLPNL